MVAGGIGHDRHAASRDPGRDLLRRVGCEVAEPIGMTDGDMSLHAECDGAVANFLDGESTHRTCIMKMDVDIDAVLLGHAEDHVEMAIDVAVEACRIKTTDKVCAKADGLIKKLRRARAFQDAALWKGDQLDVDHVLIFLAHSEDGFQRL